MKKPYKAVTMNLATTGDKRLARQFAVKPKPTVEMMARAAGEILPRSIIDQIAENIIGTMAKPNPYRLAFNHNDFIEPYRYGTVLKLRHGRDPIVGDIRVMYVGAAWGIVLSGDEVVAGEEWHFMHMDNWEPASIGPTHWMDDITFEEAP